MGRRVFKSFKEASKHLGVVHNEATHCHFYIFRHGQSFFNKQKIFTGLLDSKLTPQGRKDAEHVAHMLADKQIDVAVQTRLSRSKDTLEIVLLKHPECRLIIQDDRMIERNYGKLAGQSKEAYIAKYGQEAYEAIHRGYHTGPPGGESFADVEKRVIPFVHDLLAFMRKHKVNVAISAHGNSMRPFRRHFENLTIKEMCNLENPWDRYFGYHLHIAKHRLKGLLYEHKKHYHYTIKV